MLPTEFCERMKTVLLSEYEEFMRALEDEPVRGARVNLLKTDEKTFSGIKKNYSATPIGYASCGYILDRADSVGTSPEHHSGMIYVQDPGAMATVNAVDIMPGARVLDACAAPGGKSSQAAAIIGHVGFLFANEFVPKRAKITLGNFERLGIGSAILTSLDTKALGEMFSEYFDLAIADAPCSGEGMFRKSSLALADWSVRNIETSAKRQKEILENISGTVKPGGYLLYSTCTYAIEENERVVDSFLSSHTEFSLVPVKEALKDVTRDGITLPDMNHSMKEARRVYPHAVRGEGQFIALMKKDGGCAKERVLYKDSSRDVSRSDMEVVKRFFKENLKAAPEGRIRKVGENLVLIPHGCPVPEHSVFMSGVLIGEISKNILFPSHHFFSVYGRLFIRQENLLSGDSRVEKYLYGEEIEAKDAAGESGFLAVLYEGAPLGGGKVSSGRIKNHYPKGLRNKK